MNSSRICWSQFRLIREIYGASPGHIDSKFRHRNITDGCTSITSITCMVASFCSICRFFSLSSSFWFSSSDRRLLRAGSTLYLSNSSPLTSSTWRYKTKISQVNSVTLNLLLWLPWLPCSLTWSFCQPSFSGVQLQRWTHVASCPDSNPETQLDTGNTLTQYIQYTLVHWH